MTQNKRRHKRDNNTSPFLKPCGLCFPILWLLVAVWQMVAFYTSFQDRLAGVGPVVGFGWVRLSCIAGVVVPGFVFNAIFTDWKIVTPSSVIFATVGGSLADCLQLGDFVRVRPGTLFAIPSKQAACQMIWVITCEGVNEEITCQSSSDAPKDEPTNAELCPRSRRQKCSPSLNNCPPSHEVQLQPYETGPSLIWVSSQPQSLGRHRFMWQRQRSNAWSGLGPTQERHRNDTGPHRYDTSPTQVWHTSGTCPTQVRHFIDVSLLLFDSALCYYTLL